MPISGFNVSEFRCVLKALEDFNHLPAINQKTVMGCLHCVEQVFHENFSVSPIYFLSSFEIKSPI